MSGNRRFVVAFAFVLVAALVLPMGVFAASDDDSSGFSLWDLLDGIGGFFRDLINAIARNITSLITSIKNGINAVIGAIAKVIKAIGDAVNQFLSGLKTLFIPSRESFAKFRDDVLGSFDKKFGSLFSALNYLKTRFNGLSAKKDLSNTFKIAFPKGNFLNGISIDFLASSSGVFAFVRFSVTGLCCLVTALMCYNKVIGMVNK